MQTGALAQPYYPVESELDRHQVKQVGLLVPPKGP